ncbi:MAG TPA: 2-oxoglutarate dehydrogenase E1 component [Verrucomicrobiales bacterium]|nr:2-oxoglutarate dehydrogenase E1 component [Verrucomicrobiales bacterium]
MSSTISARMNVDLLEEKYQQWKENPRSVEATWASFFEGFELGVTQPKPKTPVNVLDENRGVQSVGMSQQEMMFRANVARMLEAYRALGHTAAWLDPLSPRGEESPRLSLQAFGFTEGDLDSEVETMFYNDGRRTKLRTMIERLRKTYCDRIGFEFMHILNYEVRDWLMARIEARVDLPNTSTEVRENVLRWLWEAETFEQFLHTKYKGQKRFSLEGGESAMVVLNAILQECTSCGIQEISMGMAHRGRLTVLANFLQKPLKVILHEFSENYIPDLVAGDGDVKYHLGYEVKRRMPGGDVRILLAPNPSHLEAVNPVVEGIARAKQRALNDGLDRKGVLPLLMHGDAAFAGQGMVAEVLNLSQLPGYRTGGTIHLVVNNQIGFTTSPADARSSAYCTDVAKMIEAPVFHVNGEHPLEVYFVAKLALEFRQKFGRDVVIDMYCYRRHGHNETDEPSFTQPKVSKLIASKPTVGTIFREKLTTSGEVPVQRADAILAEIQDRHEREHAALLEIEKTHKGSDLKKEVFAGSTAVFQPEYTHDPVTTGLPPERFRELGLKITDVPAGFRLHPTVKRTVVDKRRAATEAGGPYDWSHAEHLAFASLLTDGRPVRLSGQDVRRGTFSQRHACFYDTENRDRFIPLQHLSETQATFRVYNSLLSEAAVLGFDYGYSLMAPDMLVLWEAQFGDFSNGAQVIIDQFIASAESKWQKPSSITLLLPHGYEGQGPEHSSARLERFLQLCADCNMQVCNLTTPAQYFHLLRRQVNRPFRKPLVIMTPKSMLRNPQAVSTEADFTGDTGFREMLDDDTLLAPPSRITRLVFCSGKVYYDLINYRNEQKIKTTAIIRIEQLYPFHEEMLKQIAARYPKANKKWVWCQEEPLNMGAWSYIVHRLEKFTDMHVRYAGRDRAASPAVGSSTLHKAEQKQLVEKAFEV